MGRLQEVGRARGEWQGESGRETARRAGGGLVLREHRQVAAAAWEAWAQRCPASCLHTAGPQSVQVLGEGLRDQQS